MSIFRKKIICKKFFTYKTRTIDISGLSAGLSKEQLSGLSLKVGEFHLKPEFVKASERLQELDMLQFSLCQTIKNIDNSSKQDELLIELAQLKMQMLKIAQQPQTINNSKNLNKTMEENKSLAAIKELLVDNNTVKDALNLLRKEMPNENSLIMLTQEYKQLQSDIMIGIKDYTSMEWRSLINKIMLFIDSKSN